MLPEMLLYYKVLLTKNPNAYFLFVTNENPSTILSKAKEINLKTDRIVIKSCIHKEVPHYISLFDASIFFIRPTYSKKASSPTKQGEIMAMGKPLICNAGVGDTDRIVEKYKAGTVIQVLNESVFEEHCSFENFNAEETIRGAHEFFSLKMGVERYSNIYSSLTH